MNDPRFAASHPVNQIPAELMQLGTGKFEPKLSNSERCQILALRMAGMSIGAVAVAFKVNRRTVTHIYNEDSPRYHSIRKIRDQMGAEAFITKYINEDVIDRVKQAATTPEAMASYAKHDATEPTKTGSPNQRATKSAGITPHKGPNHTFTHRIEIGWVEDKPDYPKGWYSRLLDVETIDKDEWFGNPDENSHLTSGTALAYARQYCNDNY